MSNQIKIYNANIITPFRLIKGGSILIKDGKIEAVNAGNLEVPNAKEINANGAYVSPGFIDIHVHGGGGFDFMDGSVDAFLKIAECHAKYGTTSLTPTTLTSEKEDLLKTLDDFETAHKINKNGAQFIGMHLEGPYFAMSQRGAQDPRFIRNPDPKEYEEVLAYSKSIARWSAAPELKGAIEFGRYLRSKGVLAAIAHTDAIYEEALEAFENGYTLATHFYSSMSGVSRKNAHRFAGVIEAGYLIDEMDVEIIADGVHLPAPLLKLIYKIKGSDKIALITDAMRGAGMPPGDSVLGNINTGLKVIVEDGVAKLPDRSSFAGSVATADRLLRTMIKEADIPLIEAIKMATATPARIMGVDHKIGSLVVGKDADVIIFDDNINIQTTIIKGNIVYQNGEQEIN
ncbi:N-acetylglucosamine-6-phosphate deacetylase [Pedobacter psychrophilus]|uniref:N-acetylglucosamine-6-phosphate deacetylase n=1 Tax=Pedobacter psychrophilus TaxID=1826909 RepID=A0A179DC35_9SPHI|nr:N-acetylglucosamine-6-phosphate deacetylase [Pedobacter psychrophilus]OAQ38023.1 N-acetylglucosamine-6-phosphate deacetylase [Pedobacter psychrophilus]